MLLQSPLLQGWLAFLAVFGATLVLSPGAGSPQVILQSVLLQLLLVFGVPAALSVWLRLGYRTVFCLRPTSAGNLLWCTVLTFCTLFLLDEIALWQEKFTGVSPSLSPEIQRLLRAESMSDLIWIVLSLALVPALCEELLFRGFIFSRFLTTGNLGQSLMMTAVLFGVFHRSLAVLLTVSLAGLLLGFVVWRTGSLYNAIVVHAVINGWAIAVANTELPQWLPWLEPGNHVPVPLLLGCIAGIVVASKFLSPWDGTMGDATAPEGAPLQ